MTNEEDNIAGGVLCKTKGGMCYGATGKQKLMDKPFVVLSGPFEKCPHKRLLRGFQVFRYCTRLF